MLKQSNAISKTKILKEDYPLNLLLAISGDWNLEIPKEITTDICAGIKYALSTLGDKEQKILNQRYELRKKLSEIADIMFISLGRVRTIECEALRKLRTPLKWQFIKNGIEGCTLTLKTQAYDRGYEVGYRDGYDKGILDASNGIGKSGMTIAITKLPLEALILSNRAYNSLQAAGYKFIEDIINLSIEKILHIHNLGVKSRIEIALALQKYGITHTQWHKCIAR